MRKIPSETFAAGLAGDSRGASAGIFMRKSMGVVQRQEMGMSYDLPGKILGKSLENLGASESWEFMGHEWGFALNTLGIFVKGTFTYTQAIAGLITPLLSHASGSCYIMFKLSDIIRHPQRKFMEKLGLLSGIFLWKINENHENRDFPIYRLR